MFSLYVCSLKALLLSRGIVKSPSCSQSAAQENRSNAKANMLHSHTHILCINSCFTEGWICLESVVLFQNQVNGLWRQYLRHASNTGTSQTPRLSQTIIRHYQQNP